DAYAVVESAAKHGINLRALDRHLVCIAVDETTTLEDIRRIWDSVRKANPTLGADVVSLDAIVQHLGESKIENRKSNFLTHPVFNTHHTETEMLRYLRRLESRDLSLTTSMIPLGSCTMKLNATAEMFPLSWPEFSK